MNQSLMGDEPAPGGLAKLASALERGLAVAAR